MATCARSGTTSVLPGMYEAGVPGSGDRAAVMLGAGTLNLALGRRSACGLYGSDTEPLACTLKLAANHGAAHRQAPCLRSVAVASPPLPPSRLALALLRVLSHPLLLMMQFLAAGAAAAGGGAVTG